MRQGLLLNGILDKNQIGSSAFGIVHACHEVGLVMSIFMLPPFPPFALNRNLAPAPAHVDVDSFPLQPLFPSVLDLFSWFVQLP